MNLAKYYVLTHSVPTLLGLIGALWFSVGHALSVEPDKDSKSENV